MGFLNRDLIGGLVWLSIGMVFSIGGLHYKIFSSGEPGPGLVPLIGGVILSSLSLIVIFSSIRKNEEREKFFPEHDSFKKVSYAIIALAFYIAVLEYLGFFLSTFFILLFLLRSIQPLNWRWVWVIVILTSVSFQLIFRNLLKIPFPKGIIGL